MKRREDELLAHDPDKPDDECRKWQGHEIVQAETRDQRRRSKCAGHVKLAMREVHDPHDAEYDGEAERGDDVADAVGDPEDGELCNKIDHAFCPSLAKHSLGSFRVVRRIDLAKVL
ncbi:MAG: hypothetical protein HZB49_00350 [Bradyrhizobium sp.]|nr:hypothetical protein [Bradyrhizobium sp.]MBI5317887.1 hypothetical protein [Bradyrhizobium sp.]